MLERATAWIWSCVPAVTFERSQQASFTRFDFFECRKCGKWLRAPHEMMTSGCGENLERQKPAVS